MCVCVCERERRERERERERERVESWVFQMRRRYSVKQEEILA